MRTKVICLAAALVAFMSMPNTAAAAMGVTGSLSLTPSKMVVSGGTLYLDCSGTVHAVAPSTFSETGQLSIPASDDIIALSGNYLFHAEAEAFSETISYDDISGGLPHATDRNSTMTGYFMDFDSKGSILYAPSYSGGPASASLDAYDVTDPGHVVRILTGLTINGAIQRVLVSGNTLWIPKTTSLAAYDVGTPASPRAVATPALGGVLHASATSGNGNMAALVADYAGNWLIRVYGVSEGQVREVVEVKATGSSIQDAVAYNGAYAFYADGSKLHVIDLSTGTVVQESLDLGAVVERLLANGSDLYASVANGKLLRVDISGYPAGEGPAIPGSNSASASGSQAVSGSGTASASTPTAAAASSTHDSGSGGGCVYDPASGPAAELIALSLGAVLVLAVNRHRACAPSKELAREESFRQRR